MDNRLRSLAVAIIALFAFGAFAPRSAWLDYCFGFEAWRGFGILPLLPVALLLLALVFLPSFSEWLARWLGVVTELVPRVARLPLLVLFAGAGYYLFTNHRLSGDAMSIVLRAAEGTVSPSNPLTSWLHLALAKLPGPDPREAVRLTSVGAGVVFTLAAFGIARLTFPDRARRAGVVTLLLTCGAGILFFGTLEVYAPLAAGTALYLWAGIRCIATEGSLCLPALVLGITFCFHGAAGLLLPSLLLLANDGRFRPVRLRRLMGAGAVFLVPVLATFAALYFLTWGGAPPVAGPERYGTFLGALGQGPLLPLVKTTANLPYRYALLDLDHFLGVLNVILLAAPAGVVLLVSRRPPRRDPVFRWVGSAALFLVIFPLFWNVSFSLRRDFDLFVTMGVPLALLAGLSILRDERRPGRVLSVAALSLFAFVPFVRASHEAPLGAYAADVARAYKLAPSRDRDQHSARLRWERIAKAGMVVERELHRAADVEVRAGSGEEAVRRMRAAIRRDPGNGRLLTHLGMILEGLGRDAEAEETYWGAVRADPSMLGAWIRLAKRARRTGDDGRAVELLERGLRVSSRHDLSAEAYRELASALRWTGRTERARAADRLAEAREDR